MEKENFFAERKMNVPNQKLLKIIKTGFLTFFLVLLFPNMTPAQEEISQKFWGCPEENRLLELQEPPLKGPDVLELEERLSQLGFEPGLVDGVFDADTQKALALFQQGKGLEATGTTTPATWEALGEDCEPVAQEKTPPPTGKLKIVIHIEAKKLTVYADGKPYKSYPIAIGKPKTPSPVGEWKIINKSAHWGTGFGTRWMGLNVPWGIYGIHGTNKPWSIGTAASQGCFRMFNQHVEEIYSWVKVGTPVIVYGPIQDFEPRTLKNGHTGQDVVLVQLKLRQAKLLWTPADGRFGSGTEQALKYYQLLNGLPATGEVDSQTWQLLLQEGEEQNKAL